MVVERSPHVVLEDLEGEDDVARAAGRSVERCRLEAMRVLVVLLLTEEDDTLLH